MNNDNDTALLPKPRLSRLGQMSQFAKKMKTNATRKLKHMKKERNQKGIESRRQKSTRKKVKETNVFAVESHYTFQFITTMNPELLLSMTNGIHFYDWNKYGGFKGLMDSVDHRKGMDPLLVYTRSETFQDVVHNVCVSAHVYSWLTATLLYYESFKEKGDILYLHICPYLCEDADIGKSFQESVQTFKELLGNHLDIMDLCSGNIVLRFYSSKEDVWMNTELKRCNPSTNGYGISTITEEGMKMEESFYMEMSKHKKDHVDEFLKWFCLYYYDITRNLNSFSSTNIHVVTSPVLIEQYMKKTLNALTPQTILSRQGNENIESDRKKYYKESALDSVNIGENNDTDMYTYKPQIFVVNIERKYNTDTKNNENTVLIPILKVSHLEDRKIQEFAKSGQEQETIKVIKDLYVYLKGDGDKSYEKFIYSLYHGENLHIVDDEIVGIDRRFLLPTDFHIRAWNEAAMKYPTQIDPIQPITKHKTHIIPLTTIYNTPPVVENLMDLSQPEVIIKPSNQEVTI